jgi:anti-sigma factor RsiW
MTASDHQLLAAYLDGELTAPDMERLERLLEGSAEARKRLRLLATIDEGLCDLAPARPDITPIRRGLTKASFYPMLPWGIAAAACLTLLWQSRNSLPKADPVRAGEGWVALLVDEAAAVFEEGRSPEDAIRFAAGDYHLVDGAVHVRFANGADLVMRAPVEFTVKDAFHVEVANGNVRAIVPPPAQGFTITSPGVAYEDLGTEFGVMVDGRTGVSELHVFDGEVNVRDPETSELLHPAEVGDSFQFDGTDLKRAEGAEQNDFLTPGAIGYLRWDRWRERFADSPGLIGFYSFKDSGEQLVNSAKDRGMSDGTISGARWVTGRWPEKQALLFDRDTDYVEFDLPGEFSELSIAVWMKVDRYDHELSAIFDSNEWEPGDLHWQISRVGVPWFGVNDTTVPRKFSGDLISPGQWVHLVMVMSGKENRADVYVNGTVVNRGEFPDSVLVTPGRCRLGNWLQDPEWAHAPVRALRGRIDELAVWNRPLSEKEIKEIMKIGQPAPLWSVSPDFPVTQNF